MVQHCRMKLALRAVISNFISVINGSDLKVQRSDNRLFFSLYDVAVLLHDINLNLFLSTNKGTVKFVLNLY